MICCARSLQKLGADKDHRRGARGVRGDRCQCRVGQRYVADELALTTGHGARLATGPQVTFT